MSNPLSTNNPHRHDSGRKIKSVSIWPEPPRAGAVPFFIASGEIKTSDDFLQQIENLAEKIGLDIKNIKLASDKDETLYNIFSVRLEIKDDILALAQFLYIFTNEFRNIGIESINIKGENKTEVPKANLVISALVFKE